MCTCKDLPDFLIKQNAKAAHLCVACRKRSFDQGLSEQPARNYSFLKFEHVLNTRKIMLSWPWGTKHECCWLIILEKKRNAMLKLVHDKQNAVAAGVSSHAGESETNKVKAEIVGQWVWLNCIAVIIRKLAEGKKKTMKFK